MNYSRKALMVCLLLIAAAFAVASAQEDAAVTASEETSAAVSDTVVTADSAAAGDNAAADTAADISAANDTAAAESAPPPRGLDIDALLADDDDDDLLADYKPAVAPAVKDSAAVDSSAVSPSTEKEQLADGYEDAPAADGTDAAVLTEPAAGEEPYPVPHGRRGAPEPVAAPADAGPVVIEDGRTINFAQNLKEYRSPRLAMLLSLIVPGLGQAYSRSYVKAGAFGASEIAIISVAAYFNWLGKSKKRDAHRFADEHFDINKLRDYDMQLRQEFQRRIDLPELPENESERIIDWTYFPPYDDEFYNAANKRQTYFYESIRGVFFTPGWKDNEPSLDDILALRDDDIITVTDGSQYMLHNAAMITAWPDYFYRITRIRDAAGNRVSEGLLLGHSNYQTKYDKMVRDANSYHDAVNYTLYALLLNHIASAIDAGFTARAYNAKLLGDDRSVWNRLSVEQQYVFTGSDLSPGLMLKVRF
jgi:hypothetical protein